MKRMFVRHVTRLRPLVVVVVGAVVLAACDSRRTEPAAPPATSPAPAVNPPSPAASPPGKTGASEAPSPQARSGSAAAQSAPMGGKAVSAADVAFVANAASAGTLEVEASRVALEKAKSEAVRSFAQKMVDEHSKVGAQLRALTVASSVGNVAAMTPTDGERLRKLKELNGRDFDREYVARMGVAAHQDAVAEFQKAAESASDPQVRTFAQATLPELQAHLKAALVLARQVGATAAAQQPGSLARSK
jgi:putative membrane protein